MFAQPKKKNTKNIEITPDSELINKFEINPTMNCLIYVESGQCYLSESLLSLR